MAAAGGPGRQRSAAAGRPADARTAPAATRRDSGEDGGGEWRRRWRRCAGGGYAAGIAATATRRATARWPDVDRSDARFRRNRDNAMEGLRSRMSGARIETRATF
ncbi:hypothetical protein Syun_025990 [Stephania yunnanensis]|uniref:Uncharacterized protein n=1 Tax=Stephania yunnanensis TaxID=152371 RepID=A0AAP0EVC2_9MAGN